MHSSKFLKLAEKFALNQMVFIEKEDKEKELAPSKGGALCARYICDWVYRRVSKHIRFVLGGSRTKIYEI